MDSKDVDMANGSVKVKNDWGVYSSEGEFIPVSEDNNSLRVRVSDTNLSDWTVQELDLSSWVTTKSYVDTRVNSVAYVELNSKYICRDPYDEGDPTFICPYHCNGYCKAEDDLACPNKLNSEEID